MSMFFKIVLLSLSLIGACVLFMALREPIDTSTGSELIYHPDRKHLWNRMHATFFVRVGPDRKTYGADRLEPLLWTDTKHLLQGPSSERAVAVLEEFLQNEEASRIGDPLKRAMMQRDLWLVFNWLAKNRVGEPEHQKLGSLLAKAIHRLALTSEQIRNLPDNYAMAVASEQFADHFDPDHPERAYLPKDLFRHDGPWVCVGRTDGETAPQHLREDGTNLFTNSTFFVFLNLPGGRDATLAFLKRAKEFEKPLLIPNPDAKSRRAAPYLPSPNLPQFPNGTAVALVRRALLVDSEGRVVPSPLTESIQMRVVRGDTPTLTADSLDFTRRGLQRSAKHQAFFEFRLARADLFANKAGGLRDVSGDRELKTGFRSKPSDDFEEPLRPEDPFPERAQPFESNRASCVVCHTLPGVYSFNSYQDFRFAPRRDVDKFRPHPIAPMSMRTVEKAAIEWKEGQPGWEGLKNLLPE